MFGSALEESELCWAESERSKGAGKYICTCQSHSASWKRCRLVSSPTNRLGHLLESNSGRRAFLARGGSADPSCISLSQTDKPSGLPSPASLTEHLFLPIFLTRWEFTAADHQLGFWQDERPKITLPLSCSSLFVSRCLQLIQREVFSLINILTFLLIFTQCC